MTVSQSSGIQSSQGYAEDVWRVSGRCLDEGVWKVSGRFCKVSGRCLEGVWKVSEECMEGQARVGKVKTGQVRTCLVRT